MLFSLCFSLFVSFSVLFPFCSSFFPFLFSMRFFVVLCSSVVVSSLFFSFFDPGRAEPYGNPQASRSPARQMCVLNFDVPTGPRVFSGRNRFGNVSRAP